MTAAPLQPSSTRFQVIASIRHQLRACYTISLNSRLWMSLPREGTKTCFINKNLIISNKGLSRRWKSALPATWTSQGMATSLRKSRLSKTNNFCTTVAWSCLRIRARKAPIQTVTNRISSIIFAALRYTRAARLLTRPTFRRCKSRGKRAFHMRKVR